MSLENTRVRVMVEVLGAALGFVVTFLTISITFGFGFERTFLLSVIFGLSGWIIANAAVQRRLQKTSGPSHGAQPGATGISCMECGTIEVLAPPDSVYVWPKLEPCSQGDSKSMKWVCRNYRCNKKNVTYWDRYHPPY